MIIIIVCFSIIKLRWQNRTYKLKYVVVVLKIILESIYKVGEIKVDRREKKVNQGEKSYMKREKRKINK